MSKERLEEIKNKYKNVQRHFSLFNIELTDFEYLIQQAEKVPGLERDRKYWYETYWEQVELSRGQINKLQERVQELERRNKELAEGIEFNNKEYGKVIDENNRYKEALEEIAKEIYLEGDSNLVTQNKLIRVILKARQGLKGESE